MKVAIVHDWLNQIGGAEEVLCALKGLFPEAPVYTSIYWQEKMPEEFRSWDIRCSFMNKMPFVKQHHQPFLPFYPIAFETFDLGEYDVVISNKSGFCHGVITPPETMHICYCLTPTRYLWNYSTYLAREGVGKIARIALVPFINYLRLWDRLAADRVDHFISISETIRQRVKKYYRRDSQVIYPPVKTSHFESDGDQEDYFLIVSRLIPYKRIDLAVRAFNEVGLPLVVIGDGRDRAKLEAMARPNIRFLGRVSTADVKRYLHRCRAFVFPGLEDFGIAPVEALAAGRPVIAYAGGGALDTVKEGISGQFFYPQTVEALAEAIRRFDHTLYDSQRIRREADRFELSVFEKQIMAFVRDKWEQHQTQMGRSLNSFQGTGPEQNMER